MRYSSDSGRIIIGLKEFVNIARRGIGGSLSHDQNEPLANEISLCKELTLRYGFEAGGYPFELIGTPSMIEGGRIITLFELEGKIDRASRAEIAQARAEAFILGKMYCEISGRDNVEIAVRYISKENNEEKLVTENVGIKKLNSFFQKCAASVGLYAEPEVERVTHRLPSLKSLKFPFTEMREGQSDFVKSVYRSISRGGTLFACAPTGTGKTVSVLYPALRALGEERFDKIFYLTPKGTTSEAVRECIELLGQRGAQIRSLIISSKERCCPNGLACRDGLSFCENSECKRLPDAVLELYKSEKSVIDAVDVGKIAAKYSVCPYETELAYAELCDVVVCDFNYLFDPVVYIRRFFVEGGRYAFLIDEAHNLPDRAREMYSAVLNEEHFDALGASGLFHESSRLKTQLDRAKEKYVNILLPYLKEDMRADKDGNKIGFTHLSDVPWELYELTSGLIELTEAELTGVYSSTDESKASRIRILRDFLYRLKSFAAALDDFDDRFKLFVSFKDGKLGAKLFCVDTGRLIKKRLEKGHGAVFFSATLSPIAYYKSVLGGDVSSETVEIGSPFDHSQLSVSIMDKISTRYSEREKTLPAVCKAIAAALSPRRGNYMVFAPSFEYCEALANYFREKYPKIKIIAQTKNMTKSQKEEFLESFKRQDSSYLVGFCVMGGIYSEGVDLVGDSLIGAIVVGIGIPSLSVEREAMAEYYQDRYEEGKTFAYIYPGMNRVLQAAGRVIRTENDKGIILLIDDRFDDPIYKKSIPKLWKGLRYIGNFKELNERITKFWSEADK